MAREQRHASKKQMRSCNKRWQDRTNSFADHAGKKYSQRNRAFGALRRSSAFAKRISPALRKYSHANWLHLTFAIEPWSQEILRKRMSKVCRQVWTKYGPARPRRNCGRWPQQYVRLKRACNLCASISHATQRTHMKMASSTHCYSKLASDRSPGSLSPFSCPANKPTRACMYLNQFAFV